MRVLWVDAGNGAAGDMLLAALLDAGAPVDAVRAGLAKLAMEPVELVVDQVRRHGLRGCQVTLRAPESPVRRGLTEVSDLIRRADLPAPVAEFATATFRRLADAEARVHGVAPAEVHFHEVGALDAIADVVGTALALHELGLLAGPAQRVVSAVAVGHGGTVRAAHGRLPVPTPAVLELLAAAGAPLAPHPARMELCTPTGAALLTTLATGWGPPPACTLRRVGAGAGAADPRTHPNLVRVLIGEATPAAGDDPTGPGAAAWTETELWQVETTVDDMDPRLWPELLERLREAGAADAWCVPVLMRKGRPGQVLTVLVDAGRVDLVCRLVFTHTTSLGVRVQPVRRRALHRDQVEVAVAGGTVRVKRGHLDGRVVTVQPEYEDAVRLAWRTGAAVADLIGEATAAARRAGDSDTGGTG